MDNKNYNINQGDSFVLQVIYESSTGSAINLTGYSASFAVADKFGGSPKIVGQISNIAASGTTGTNVSVSTASSGIFNINIPPSETFQFFIPQTAYQFKITSPGGIGTTLGQGYFMVNAGII